MARILVLLLLYLFLFLVVQALRQDLRTAPRQAGPAPTPGTAPTGKATGKPVAGAPRLELIDAGQTPLPLGQVFPLRNPLTIGRAASNDITLDDDWVSAQHLRLRHQKGAWMAEDLGSTNGTRVNGHPLKGAITVKPGDILDLGRVKFRLAEGA